MKLYTLYDGDQMPALGLGTWKFDSGQGQNIVREAIKIGYRHFDCATRYENEKEIGLGLLSAIKAGDVQREELWITTKLWNNAHQKDRVLPALETSLSDLQIEYVDLYLMHWPIALKPHIIFPSQGIDFLSLEEVPLLETWEAMIECKEKGLCKHIGVSNFTINKIRHLSAKSGVSPAVNQVESHPLLQQNDLLTYCRDQEINLTAYSPLGSGDRPARLIENKNPNLLKNPVIREIADHHQVSPAQILIAWAIQRGTTVIPKSAHPGRLRQNFEAATMRLQGDEMDAIANLDQGFRYISGNFWAIEGSPYTVEDLWYD